MPVTWLTWLRASEWRPSCPPHPPQPAYRHLEKPGESVPRHQGNMVTDLSYVSTDLFRTKISPANTKVAFLPLGAHHLLWDLSIYIQPHKQFPIQIGFRNSTQKLFMQNSKSAQATNWIKGPGSAPSPSHPWAFSRGVRCPAVPPRVLYRLP